jgi:hypothetical protein
VCDRFVRRLAGDDEQAGGDGARSPDPGPAVHQQVLTTVKARPKLGQEL